MNKFLALGPVICLAFSSPLLAAPQENYRVTFSEETPHTAHVSATLTPNRNAKSQPAWQYLSLAGETSVTTVLLQSERV